MTFVLARPRSTLALAGFVALGLLAACDQPTTAPASPARFTPDVSSAYQTHPTALQHRWGTPQGHMDKEPIYWNSATGAPNVAQRHEYGLKFQCVEFVRRYYGKFYSEKLPGDLDAAGYWTAAMPHNLRRVANGGFELPEKGDIIVMADLKGGPGHIAIVRSASRSEVRIAQQNTLQPDQGLSVRATSKGGTPLYDIPGITGYRTLGWFSRRSTAPVLTLKIESAAPSKPKVSTRAQRLALATAGVNGAVAVTLTDPAGAATTFSGGAVSITPGGLVFQPKLTRTGKWSVIIKSGAQVSNRFTFSVSR